MDSFATASSALSITIIFENTQVHMGFEEWDWNVVGDASELFSQQWHHHVAERCRCNGTSGLCPRRCWPSDSAAVHADPSCASQDRPVSRHSRSRFASPLAVTARQPLSSGKGEKAKRRTGFNSKSGRSISLVISNQSLACTTLHLKVRRGWSPANGRRDPTAGRNPGRTILGTEAYVSRM